jgi:hypothetical protein
MEGMGEMAFGYGYGFGFWAVMIPNIGYVGVQYLVFIKFYCKPLVERLATQCYCAITYNFISKTSQSRRNAPAASDKSETPISERISFFLFAITYNHKVAGDNSMDLIVGLDCLRTRLPAMLSKRSQRSSSTV